ncbi:MAG: isocitrate lyase/PEP mutase family protein [Acetobacteraceae bacterium]|nr:isocitrate lyase/PEP mutase family protein [Acetobacteraceae bacterium]
MSHDPRSALRAILSGSEAVVPASVFDPISMRLAGDLGFRLGMLAGSTASLAVLGAPDIVVLTLSEFADIAGRVTRAGAIPLLVDADHGYGNAQNVQRCVFELERAGISGMTLEDTDLPNPYASSAPRLITREEGLGKIRAALAARRDPGLVIVGRTSAVSIAGVGEAVARAQNYQAAGADALFFTGVDDLATLETIRAGTTLPIILGGSKITDNQALAERGVRIALRGHQPIMAAIEAVRATYIAQRDGTALPALVSAGELAKATREADYKAVAANFLGA